MHKKTVWVLILTLLLGLPALCGGDESSGPTSAGGSGVIKMVPSKELTWTGTVIVVSSRNDDRKPPHKWIEDETVTFHVDQLSLRSGIFDWYRREPETFLDSGAMQWEGRVRFAMRRSGYSGWPDDNHTWVQSGPGSAHQYRITYENYDGKIQLGTDDIGGRVDYDKGVENLGQDEVPIADITGTYKGKSTKRQEKWTLCSFPVYTTKRQWDPRTRVFVGKETKQVDERKVVTISWNLTLGKARHELRYGKTALDIAAMVYPGKAVDPQIFIAQAGGGSSWLPHANFAGEVWVDGLNKVEIHPGPAPRGLDGRAQNVKSDYKIRREARSWDLDKPGKGQWFDDNPDPIQDWIDNPGISVDAGPPPTWNRRVMDEFLVQVDGHPEFGRIYVVFVMEIRNAAYRIRYSTPMSISKEQYDSIKSSREPFFPYPFTDKDEGWVQLVQDPNTKEWKPRTPVP